jgi:quercetin dioxygenase-like cupin family protein
MSTQRLFTFSDYLQPAEQEPIRSVVSRNEDTAIIAWHVQAGQHLAAHSHPSGQDTWVIMSGTGTYQLDKEGTTMIIKAGDVVIAPTGAVHGVYNHGTEPLTFVGIVAPAESGFELLG